MSIGNPFMNFIPPSLGFGGPMHTLLVGLDDFVILEINTLKKLYKIAANAATTAIGATQQSIRDHMIVEILKLYGISRGTNTRLVQKSKLFICKPPLFMPSEYKGEDLDKLNLVVV